MAIDAALSCKWDDALEINRALSKVEPQNVECLNRLARACFELGKYPQAKKIYQEVLKLDIYNSIAQKNLKRVIAMKKVVPLKQNGQAILMIPSLFLEEPGITKVVTLIKVAEPQKLLSLSAGLPVNLVIKGKGITVLDTQNKYLGVLPDDIAHHLSRLIKGGNKYFCLIKSIKSNSLTVLIRETFRSKKFRNQASFIDDAKALTYSSDNISLLDDEGMQEETEGGEEGVELV